jgi:hypothetical protein
VITGADHRVPVDAQIDTREPEPPAVRRRDGGGGGGGGQRSCVGGRGVTETVAERFVRALGTGDDALLDEVYDPEVVLYTPLAWPLRGRGTVKDFVREFHRAYPGLRVTLHDQFFSADGTRACFRFVIHYTNVGPFYGHSPTGESGTMSETHAVRIREDAIIEQVVGDNNFSMPYQELVTWQMEFPRETPDPNPVLLEAGGEPRG